MTYKNIYYSFAFVRGQFQDLAHPLFFLPTDSEHHMIKEGGTM